MAEFGNTQLSSQVVPSEQVVNPVQGPSPDRSGAIIANAIGGALSNIGDFAGQFAGETIANQQAEAQSLVMSNFVQEYSAVADAVEQGVINPSAAGTQLRSIFTRYVAENPGLVKEFTSQSSSLLAASGIAHVAIEGNAEQQAAREMAQKAAAVNMTVPQYRAYLDQQTHLQRVTDEHKLILEEEGILTALQAREGRQAVTTFASTAFPAAQATIQDAMNQMDATSNPAEKAAILTDLRARIDSDIVAIENLAGQYDASYITDPINKLIDDFEAYANGTESREYMEGYMDNVSLQMQMMAMSDPELGAKLATSKLFSDLGLNDLATQLSILERSDLDKLLSLTTGETVDPAAIFNSEDEGSTRVLQMIREAAESSLMNGDITNSAAEDIKTGIDMLLETTKRANSEDPKDFQELVELLANPNIMKFVNENGGLDQRTAQEASRAISRMYSEKVVPLIQDRWTNSAPIHIYGDTYDPPFAREGGGNTPSMMGGANTPLQQRRFSEIVKPVWNGAGVMFVPQDAFKDSSRVQNWVAQLNEGSRSMAVPINNMVHATALLEGMDPKTVYETMFEPQLFGTEDQGPVPQDTTLEDLNTDDLAPLPVEQVNSALEGIGEVSESEFNDLSTSVGSQWNFGQMSSPNSLVIHHTAGRGTVEGVIQTFRDRNFPAHFIIDRNGTIHRVLAENQKGQHVKPSEVNDITNSNSWGVEIMGHNDSDILPVQVDASMRLAKYLNETYGMPLDRVFGHGELNSDKQVTEGQTVTTSIRAGL